MKEMIKEETSNFKSEDFIVSNTNKRYSQIYSQDYSGVSPAGMKETQFAHGDSFDGKSSALKEFASPDFQ